MSGRRALPLSKGVQSPLRAEERRGGSSALSGIRYASVIFNSLVRLQVA